VIAHQRGVQLQHLEISPILGALTLEEVAEVVAGETRTLLSLTSFQVKANGPNRGAAISAILRAVALGSLYRWNIDQSWVKFGCRVVW
jgi:hypothetical protein